MRIRLPTVWSSRWTTKLPACSTLVSFLKAILRRAGGGRRERRAAADDGGGTRARARARARRGACNFLRWLGVTNLS
jgi:hypothetical protein